MAAILCITGSEAVLTTKACRLPPGTISSSRLTLERAARKTNLTSKKVYITNYRRREGQVKKEWK